MPITSSAKIRCSRHDLHAMIMESAQWTLHSQTRKILMLPKDALFLVSVIEKGFILSICRIFYRFVGDFFVEHGICLMRRRKKVLQLYFAPTLIQVITSAYSPRCPALTHLVVFILTDKSIIVREQKLRLFISYDVFILTKVKFGRNNMLLVLYRSSNEGILICQL